MKVPLKEKAKNLRFGRWLIASAHSKFELQERGMNSSLPMSVKIHEGCTVCIITIRFRREIQGPNIHLKTDLETCSKEAAQQVDVQLSNPLYDLFNNFPELDSFILHKIESDFNPHYLRYTKQSQYRCHCRMVMQIYGNWRSNILLPERDSSGIKK